MDFMYYVLQVNLGKATYGEEESLKIRVNNTQHGDSIPTTCVHILPLSLSLLSINSAIAQI